MPRVERYSETLRHIKVPQELEFSHKTVYGFFKEVWLRGMIGLVSSKCNLDEGLLNDRCCGSNHLCNNLIACSLNQ